jgi:LacI family transcriptional regulator, galactose operon repressor
MRVSAGRARATIRDVARDANVSATTVSRYLNKNISLPTETAARIDRAIGDLRYHANVVAKRLLKGATELIGLATPDIGNPFFAELASAVEARAAEHGYGVILCSSGNQIDRELETLERLAARHADGLLFLTSNGDDRRLQGAFGGRRNIVLLDEDVDGLEAPRIFVENREGGRLAAKCLIEAGHTRIAHLSGPRSLFSVREREQGFREAAAEAGIAIPDSFVRYGAYDRAFGREAAAALLSAPQPPTAIFAASDYLAMGVLDALRDMGLSSPRDISLVGFDDVPFAGLLNPPLTTIRQPVRLMGERGVDALLAMIRGEPAPIGPIRLPIELIQRESVGPPKDRATGPKRARGARTLAPRRKSSKITG